MNKRKLTEKINTLLEEDLRQLNKSTLKRLKKAVVDAIDYRGLYTVITDMDDEGSGPYLIAIQNTPPYDEGESDKKLRKEYFATLPMLNRKCEKHTRTVELAKESSLPDLLATLTGRADANCKMADCRIMKYGAIDQSDLRFTVEELKEIKDPGIGFRCSCGKDRKVLDLNDMCDLLGLREDYEEYAVDIDSL